jgi:hypothetical protein
MRIIRFVLPVLSLMLAACTGGAVVFAPLPPADPDIVYPFIHPTGVFSVEAPFTWSVFTQSTPTLASASFSPPDAREPALTVGAIRLPAPIEPDELPALVERYQTQVRSDVDEYIQTGRERLADGSWRMTGVRIAVGGARQPINTFVFAQADHLFVVESAAIAGGSSDAARLRRALTGALNSVRLVNAEALRPGDLTALSFLKPTRFAPLHVRTWTGPDGAFYITGEVANYGTEPAFGVPVEANLIDAAGVGLIGAVDAVMGQGIPPGGFAPFSLRFGVQPAAASQFVLSVGAGSEPPPGALVSADGLIWTDSFRYDDFGRLVIDGAVTNALPGPVRDVRAAATVFDAAGGVIGAAWADVAPLLTADASAPFSILLPVIGGSPANYLVTVTALR